MPAQNDFKNLDAETVKSREMQDVDYFRLVQQTSLAMMTTMHGGLSEITKAVTAEEMRSIALASLAEVDRQALALGGK